MAIKVTDADFIKTWQSIKSPEGVSRALGLGIRSVYQRRNNLVNRGFQLDTVDARGRDSLHSPRVAWERSRKFEIKSGVAIVFSDPHFYPDANTVALEALLTLCRDLKPKAVFCGGDALDGTQISQYDPTRGWHQPPSLKEQLDCLTDSMQRIKSAAKGAITAMTLGNHDARLSRYLAVKAPAVEDLPGTRLEDFIPDWPLSWSIELAGKIQTVIRHRNLSGALHLQAMRAGCHYIHGHLHKLNVHAAPQYNRFVFSVDAGSFADPQSDAFDYTEDGPPHVQGFVVLTYKDGELLWPEPVFIREGRAHFRGGVIA